MTQRYRERYIPFTILGRIFCTLSTLSLQRGCALTEAPLCFHSELRGLLPAVKPTLPGDSHLAGSEVREGERVAAPPTYHTNSWFAFSPTISGIRTRCPLPLQYICKSKGCCISWSIYSSNATASHANLILSFPICFPDVERRYSLYHPISYCLNQLCNNSYFSYSYTNIHSI